MPHELTLILPPTLSSQFEVRGSWGSTTITSKENLRTLHVGAFERYGGVESLWTLGNVDATATCTR
jgi:hypothetical protein